MAKSPSLIQLKKHFSLLYNYNHKMALNEKYKKSLKHLTCGSLLTILVFIVSYSLIQSLISYQLTANIDLRLLNLIQDFRNPLLSQIMLFITYLASWQSITIAFILLCLSLILLRHWYYLATFFISISFGQIFVFFIKNLTSRPRPPLTQALTLENTFSFPSGHTFLAFSFFGLLTYFFYSTAKNKFFKTFYLTTGCLLILSVSISRIYLGAHWPSDVIASLFSGAAWVFTLITINEIHKQYNQHPNQSFLPRHYINLVSIFFIFIYELFLILFFITNPLKTPFPIKTIIVPKTANFQTQIFKVLPVYCQTLTGKLLNPINLIVIGQQNELEKTLKILGLTPTLKTKKIVFWNSQINDLVFQQKSNIFVPFWKTKLETENKPVWISSLPIDADTEKKLSILGASISNNTYLISL